MTLHEAIKIVLLKAGSLSGPAILEAIRNERLFEFKSANPGGILLNEIRRHLEGSKSATGKKIRYRKTDGNKYTLI